MLKIAITLFLFLVPNLLLAEDLKLSYSGGVYHVPVTLNDSVRLEFVIDTGAASVFIPYDVFRTLHRTGMISKSDFLGTSKVQTATGEVIEITKINIKRLQVGTQIIYNIEAAVGSEDASLLLGQSALKQLEPWSLNTSEKILTVKSNQKYTLPKEIEKNKINVKEEVAIFIDKYISRGNSRNLMGLLSLYDTKVDYFSANNASKDFIYKDKVNYFKRWPSSQTKLIEIQNISIMSDIPNTVKVTYIASFDVYNYEKKKGIKGKAKNYIVLKKSNGQLKIISDKQKVLSRESY